MPTAEKTKLMTDTPNSSETLAFPASVAQQSFWYLELLEKNVSAFNVPLRYLIEGNLDRTHLEQALRIVVSRHEILRTHFEEENGELLQIVVSEPEFKLGFHDISGTPREQMEREADRLGSLEGNRHFTLGKGPLFRAELIRLSENRHHLHLTFHHAIFDGLSIANFIHELCASYETVAAGRSDSLPPLPIQYGDFSVWQKEFLASPALDQQLSWWRNHLDGMTEPDLPTDRPRPSHKTWKGAVVTVPLPLELTEQLQSLASLHGATLFHLQLAAFNLLIHAYTGATDIPVGTPVSGRTREEMEPLIGIFINSLIIRTDLSGNPTFTELLTRVRDTFLQAIEHQDLPFENLVRALKPERDPGRNPLFQVNFSHDRFAPKPVDFAGLRISTISSRSPGAIFDLHLFLSERDGRWKAGCDYSTDLYDRSTMEQLLGHYIHLLAQVARTPEKHISDLEILPDPEARRILAEWSGSPSPYPRNETVDALFLEAVEANSDQTAMVHGIRKTSYRELGEMARSIAAKLQLTGIVPGDLVAVSAKPSEAMIASLLGILMAGGIYVPLNPADPEDRSALLINESGAKFLLTDSPHLTISEGTRIELADALSFPGNFISPKGRSAEDPAYLMFTSGSTGKPKGVLIPHRAITRLVKNSNFLPITTEDVFLHAAPTSFDASTLEIWGPLLNGARLALPDGDASLAKIASTVKEQGVTILWLTSGLFNLMIEEHADDLTGLKYLLAGGDVLSIPHVRRAINLLPRTQLINGYGPTENTTFTTCHSISRADLERPSIPIGRPISNTTIHILDSHGRPVPYGVPGELLTGGDGLAIGYHNDAALTAAKFIHHPEFGRLYRTGDRCKWTAEGIVKFIGRNDHQVKVRGFRIEPGEIEAVLANHPEVRQAKVAVRGQDSGSKRILAWVQAVPGASPTSGSIRDYLSLKLPAFMCPDGIGIVETFPINPNGKIDSSKLPDPLEERKSGDRSAPVGKTEEKLAEIWRALLDIPEVGRNDGFFELGGHSLMALRMFSRINREFDQSLPLSALIGHPTIRQLALLLEQAGQAEPPKQSGGGYLVSLAPKGSQPPLVCIHGGDGGVLFYKALATLLPTDLPVHAIESTELGNSGPITPASIEETAALYIDTLLSLRPHGPFRLAGYSFGGVVAHEMACQLTAKGHTVEFLGLLDTHNPSAPYIVNSFPKRIAAFWKNHNDTPLAPRVFKLAARFADGVATHQRVKKEEKAARTEAPDAAHGDLRRVQVRQENWRAMQAYQPRPFPGRITLFKAQDQSDKFEWPDDYGWKDYAAGGLDIITVAGQHLTLFDPENVHHLAEVLSPAIAGKRG